MRNVHSRTDITVTCCAVPSARLPEHARRAPPPPPRSEAGGSSACGQASSLTALFAAQPLGARHGARRGTRRGGRDRQLLGRVRRPDRRAGGDGLAEEHEWGGGTGEWRRWRGAEYCVLRVCARGWTYRTAHSSIRCTVHEHSTVCGSSAAAAATTARLHQKTTPSSSGASVRAPHPCTSRCVTQRPRRRPAMPLPAPAAPAAARLRTPPPQPPAPRDI